MLRLGSGVFLVCLFACGHHSGGQSSPDGATDGAVNPGGDGSASANDMANDGSTSGDGAVQTITPPAPGSCGLATPAFCDTFDAPAKNQGRAGELDVDRWSGSRLEVQLPTPYGAPFPFIPAPIPAGCRSGLPATVFPDRDTVICDPNSVIKSNFMLSSASGQNYSGISYRARQPFDFAGRTGKIVFDAQGFNSALLGWVSVEITADPIGVPSYAYYSNDEGAVIPQDALEIQFSNSCGAQPADISTNPVATFSIGGVHVFNNYADTYLAPANPACLAAHQGQLNHFEIDVSATKVDVYASPVSADGVTFAAQQLLYSTPVTLPFTRGYVHITAHNHATMKYSANNTMQSWIVQWDNFGFDGPALKGPREYEVPDAQVPLKSYPTWPDAFPEPAGGAIGIGYYVADEATGPNPAFTFKAVDLTDAASAQVALSAWYVLNLGMPSTYVLNYRVNGKAWHLRPFNAGELGLISPGPTLIQGGVQSNTGIFGGFGEMLDVPVDELVSGDNTFELTSTNIQETGGYPTAVANIDLIVTTN